MRLGNPAPDDRVCSSHWTYSTLATLEMKDLPSVSGLIRRALLGLPSFLLLVLLTRGAVEGASGELYPSPNERFGLGAPGGTAGYDVGQLHAGWYVDWGTRIDPPHPAGMEYVQMVRLHQLTECWPERTGDREACPYVVPYTYTLTSPVGQGSIVTIAQANPGSLWLIGNEMDRRDWEGGGQDEMLPQVYARAYHELYRLIKAADSTAQIAIGGVIQPTPLRLQYLGMVLDAYESRYGSRMPVDVWNIHNMILQEKSCEAYPASCYGAEVPPGVDAPQGRLYAIDDADNVGIFEQQIRDFRAWMKDRGERDKPLIISEYSVLYGESFGFDYPRVSDYLTTTFNILTTAADDSLGYPADDHRLVQRWAWYSLDDDGFEGQPSHHHLFDPATRQIVQLGIDYAQYTNSLITPYRDLRPVTFTLSPSGSNKLLYGQPATLTLRSRVVNWGNTAVDSFAVGFWDGVVPVGERLIPELGPRYQAEVVTETLWSGLLAGPHTFRVVVDSAHQVDEWREDNNEASAVLDVDLAVVQVRSYAPLVGPGESADITVTIGLSNLGDVTVNSVPFELWNGDETQLIGATVIAALDPGALAEVSFTWSQKPVGLHLLVATVDPQDLVTESDEQNNEMLGTALVPAYRAVLPLTVHCHPHTE
jgi:hypothetical protein